MLIVMAIQYIAIMYVYSWNSTVHKLVNWRRRKNGGGGGGGGGDLYFLCEFDLFAAETPKFDQGHPEIRSGSPRLVCDAAKLTGYYQAESERAYFKNSSFTRVRK